MGGVKETVAWVGLMAAAVLGWPAGAPAQRIDREAIDQIVKDALAAWKVPGAAIAVVYRGEIYSQGFGVRLLGGNKPVTPRTIFPLASCTKAFTTTALAMLADEGKLAWDDPVRKHVPFFRLADPLADAAVTLRDVVSHRTGLSGHDLLWYRAPWGQEEIIRRAGRVPLSKPFRTAYQYQSIMVMAAGWAVGTASKRPWTEFVHERIFLPLEMKRASCTTTAALAAEDHAGGHRKNADGKIEPVPWYPMRRPDPAGSINASALDMARWVQFQLGDGRTPRGKRLVSVRNLEETHQPHIVMHLEGSALAMQPETIQMSYAMGWVVQDYRGHRLVSHGGSIDGFRAHITLAPDDKLGIVLFNNLQGTQMNLAVSNTILDRVLGLEARDWNRIIGEAAQKEEAAVKAARRRRDEGRHKGTKSSRDLSAYAGRFEHPAYGTARVAFDKDKGRLSWHWSSFHGRLEHFHYDTFTAREEFLGDPLMVFRLASDGEVRGVRFLDVEFRRARK
jgi:CubicO group peptidase (beta-lactamase class C family)